MKSKKILIIANESSKKNSALEKFKNAGYKVYERSEGREALQFLHYYRDFIDIIVFDVNCDAYSGMNLCRNIRKLTDVPVIMITARYEEYEELYGNQIKDIDFFSTHISTDILLARANAILSKK